MKASPQIAPDVFTSMTAKTSPQQPCATPMGTACACWGAPYLGNRQCCAATPQRTVYLSAKHSRSLTVYHALTRTGVLPANMHGEEPRNSGSSSSTAGHEPQPMASISPQKAWDAHSNQGMLLLRQTPVCGWPQVTSTAHAGGKPADLTHTSHHSPVWRRAPHHNSGRRPQRRDGCRGNSSTLHRYAPHLGFQLNSTAGLKMLSSLVVVLSAVHSQAPGLEILWTPASLSCHACAFCCPEQSLRG